MPELLELAHLVDQHRVAHVQIRRRRIESGLDDQRLAALQPNLQPVLRQHLVGASHQFCDLFFHARHCDCLQTPLHGADSRLRDFSILAPVNTMTYNPFL